MKKSVIIIFVLVAIAACKVNENKKSNNEKIVVGISKIITHPALDAIEMGIIDELTSQGFDNIIYDLQNANGEFSTASSIAAKFRSERVKVAVGIATPSAVALANQIKDIPVVFSGVTDPISANLMNDNGTNMANVTGVSDMAPIRQQMILLSKMKNIKKLGYVYTPGEANSVSQLNKLKDICAELGIEILASAVTNTSEVKQAAEVVAPRVDAMFVSHDNTVVAALNSLTETALKYGIPVFSTDPSSASSGKVTVAYGVDNYKTGRAAGQMVAEILRGKKSGDIPVKFMTKSDELAKYVDMEQIQKYSMTLPPELLD